MPFDGTSYVGSKILRVLRGTRELLANPDKWGKGNLFSFEKFCLVGALYVTDKQLTDMSYINSKYTYEYIKEQPYIEALQTIIKERAPRMNPKREREAILWNYNDYGTTSHDDILSLLDEAIELETVKQEVV